MVFFWEINIVFESPKFDVIILLNFFELNKNKINEVEPDKTQKSELEYLLCNVSSNFLYE